MFLEITLDPFRDLNLHNISSILLTIFSFYGAYLNLKQNKWGFILWVISDFSWALYSLGIKEYGQFLVFLIYTIFSAWGYVEWHRISKKIE